MRYSKEIKYKNFKRNLAKYLNSLTIDIKVNASNTRGGTILKSKLVAVNCPNNEAAPLSLSVQQELHSKTKHIKKYQEMLPIKH